MLSSSIWLTPNIWKPVVGNLDFNDSVSMLSKDSVALELKLKACKHKMHYFITLGITKGFVSHLRVISDLTHEVNRICDLFQKVTYFSNVCVICYWLQAEAGLVGVHG